MSSDDEGGIRSPSGKGRDAALDVADAADMKENSSAPIEGSPPDLEEDKEQEDLPDENDADLFGSGSEEDEPVYVLVTEAEAEAEAEEEEEEGEEVANVH